MIRGMIRVVVVVGLWGSPGWAQSQIIRRIETPRPALTDPESPGMPASPAPVAPPITPPTPLRTPIPSSIVPRVDVLTEWHIQQNVCSGNWRPDEMTALFPQLSVAEIELICQQSALP